jgi:hypothetical protein
MTNYIYYRNIFQGKQKTKSESIDTLNPMTRKFILKVADIFSCFCKNNKKYDNLLLTGTHAIN